MAKNKKQTAFNNVYKKDTNGLFDGGFKSQEFKTQDEKEFNRKKTTKQYLDELDEEFENV